jgi:predicted nucleic acid-binding protein
VKSLRRNTISSPEVIVDTNIIFSAIFYSHGNERLLFNNTEKKDIPIIIIDYVEDELKEIFRRKDLDFGTVIDFLDTYSNIAFREIGEITDNEATIAKKHVTDIKDRPLFVYMYRSLKNGQNCYLITGDKALHNITVKKILDNRVYYSKKFLKIIKTLK